MREATVGLEVGEREKGRKGEREIGRKGEREIEGVRRWS